MNEIPQEIRERYASGERRIRVSPDVFRAYDDGLMTLYRVCPNVQVEPESKERWLAYKAARVICSDL